MKLTNKITIQKYLGHRIRTVLPVAYVAARWVLRVVSTITIIVRHRRQPSSLMAWVLFTLFIPWAGLPLYLMFGDNRLPKRELRNHPRLVRYLRTQTKRIHKLERRFQPKMRQSEEGLSNLALRMGQFPALNGNSISGSIDYYGVVEAMIKDIRAAEHTVNVLFYIYADDRTGRRFTKALLDAQRRGVKVRVLYDAAGSRNLIGRLARTMSRAGIDCHEILPMTPFRRRVQRFDLRNHRKILVVDGEIAWTGSQNIIDRDYGTKRLEWYDIMVRVKGPVVQELQVVFSTDWYFETGELLDGPHIYPEITDVEAGNNPMQVLPSGPNTEALNFQQVIIAALFAAQDEIIITTPYMIPNDPLLQALQSAVLRGVRVSLLLPAHSDHRFVDIASHSYYLTLLNSGVGIYLLPKGLLHAKMMTIDNEIALVHTGNFDIRSFELNYEVVLILYKDEVVTTIKERQQEYLDRSDRLTLEQWNQRPWYKKVVQNAAKLVSPLL